jgi:outer membrane protein assembly factor BamB
VQEFRPQRLAASGLRSPRPAQKSLPQRLVAFVATLLVLAGSTSQLRAENWPQFRGPTGLGYSGESGLPLRWGGPSGENVAWKSPLVGEGHASPIVWGDRLYVSTAYWSPEVKQREKVIPEHHVLCYRAGDGRLLWDKQVPAGPWLRSDFRSGPGGGYACPTPTTDGRLVYSAFGSAVLAAMDLEGRIVWRKELVPYTFDVTVGGSPILYRDTLILFEAMTRPQDSRVVAFDKRTGEVRWETKLPETGFGHSTPTVIRVRGADQMLVAAGGMSPVAAALQSLDPAGGRRLWWCRGAGESASPAFGAGVVYFDSGRGGPGTAVDPTGRGDVSASHVKWTIGQVPESIGSPTIVDGRVYRLHSPGVLKCWDARDGHEIYAKRLEGIFSTWASPIVDPRGRLYFATAGKSYVLAAGPEFKVLAVNDLGDGNHPSPAASGGSLYLVGMKNVWCIRGK